MKKRPFYFEIKNLIIQFMAAFNDVAIKRYNADRQTDGREIGVGFMYAPRQRVIEDIINKSKQIPLPTISVSIANIARDPERVFNKLEGYMIDTAITDDTKRKIPQPVPINITINMSIIARYQQDIEQIISNFVPYCDPYITVSWKLPTTENTTYEHEMRTIIEWGGTLNIQYPIELNNNQQARVTCDTTFTIKGWLFKQIDTSVGKIYNINSNIYPSQLGEECLIFKDSSDVAELFDTNIDEASFLLQRGRPTLKNIDIPFYFIDNYSTNTVYNIYGKDFFNIQNVYLSSNNNILTGTSLFNLFSSFSTLSALYPPFSGVEINTYKVNSLNNISLTIPQKINKTGNIDIIVKNEAGYSILSIDSYIPVPSALSAIVAESYQPPCVGKGITVK
jgi:hypothetical protein